MEKPQKTISVKMHYATMAALIVSNLCTLGLAMLFSQSYGLAIGNVANEIEKGGLKAEAASRLQMRYNFDEPIFMPRPVDPVTFSVIDSSLDRIAMARGNDGLPVFLYWQQVLSTTTPTSTDRLNSIRFAKCLDTACKTSVKRTIVGSDPDSTDVTYPSIDITVATASSTPKFAYVASLNTSTSTPLTIGSCNDTSCSSSTSRSWYVDAAPWYPVSVAVDNAGIPSVAYIGYDSKVRLARCSDTLCNSSPVVTVITAAAGNYQYPALAIRPADNQPVITYHDQGGHAVRMVLCSDSACTFRTTKTLSATAYTNGVPIFSSIDFVTATTSATTTVPIVSFNAPNSSALNANHWLRVATCHTPDCQTMTASMVDYDGYNGLYSSLRVNPSTGLPMISYLDANVSNDGVFIVMPDDVKFAACSDWQCSLSEKTEIASSDNAYVLPFGVEAAHDGKPIIALFREPFTSDGNAKLEAAKCAQNNCR